MESRITLLIWGDRSGKTETVPSYFEREDHCR